MGADDPHATRRLLVFRTLHSNHGYDILVLVVPGTHIRARARTHGYKHLRRDMTPRDKCAPGSLWQRSAAGARAIVRCPFPSKPKSQCWVGPPV